MLARIQKVLGLKTQPIVFAVSAVLIFAFVLFGAIFSEAANRLFGAMQDGITYLFGGFYRAAITFFLFFCGWLCVSRYGRVRLGKDDQKPDYPFLTWIAMLFSAGMGIGVLFWSVAEPVAHFQNPPLADPGLARAAVDAMNITLLHWGFHGWGIYVVMGVALAYFCYRRGLPLTIRSAFYPLLGDRINGWIGHAIDIFAVLGTMFGVATTLGMGTQQLNAGLHHLLGVDSSLAAQLLLIAGITAVATLSVVSGLDRGIRRLSELTMILAFVLLVYVFVAGPTGTAAWSIISGSGHYIASMAGRFFWASLGGEAGWQKDWTLFYWGWWISWAPFVGMFVARISRGRTIREFVAGVLLVPTVVSMVWFTVFGGLALDRVAGGDPALAGAVEHDFAVAIYVFFDGFPLSALLAVLGIVVVVVFFVTSSDSASLVIDYLTSGGDQDPPKRQRVFWAATEGLVAAVLLVAGGLAPMRAFQLVTGLPLCVIMLLMCYSLFRSLRRHERRK